MLANAGDATRASSLLCAKRAHAANPIPAPTTEPMMTCARIQVMRWKLMLMMPDQERVEELLPAHARGPRGMQRGSAVRREAARPRGGVAAQSHLGQL